MTTPLSQKIKKLEQHIKKYNKLPDYQKLGHQYKSIQLEIDDCLNQIAEYMDMVTNPQKYTDPEQLVDVDTNNIAQNLERIEELKDQLESSKDIDQKVEIHKELLRVISNCRNYLDQQKMEIIDV